MWRLEDGDGVMVSDARGELGDDLCHLPVRSPGASSAGCIRSTRLPALGNRLEGSAILRTCSLAGRLGRE